MSWSPAETETFVVYVSPPPWSNHSSRISSSSRYTRAPSSERTLNSYVPSSNEAVFVQRAAKWSELIDSLGEPSSQLKFTSASRLVTSGSPTGNAGSSPLSSGRFQYSPVYSPSASAARPSMLLPRKRTAISSPPNAISRVERCRVSIVSVLWIRMSELYQKNPTIARRIF